MTSTFLGLSAGWWGVVIGATAFVFATRDIWFSPLYRRWWRKRAFDIESDESLESIPIGGEQEYSVDIKPWRRVGITRCSMRLVPKKSTKGGTPIVPPETIRITSCELRDSHWRQSPGYTTEDDGKGGVSIIFAQPLECMANEYLELSMRIRAQDNWDGGYLGFRADIGGDRPYFSWIPANTDRSAPPLRPMAPVPRTGHEENFEDQANREGWRVYEVAFLWHGQVPPRARDHFDEMDLRVEQTKDMLHRAIKNGELPADERRFVGGGMTRYVTRQDLIDFCRANGYYPEFLFPDGG